MKAEFTELKIAFIPKGLLFRFLFTTSVGIAFEIRSSAETTEQLTITDEVEVEPWPAGVKCIDFKLFLSDKFCNVISQVTKRITQDGSKRLQQLTGDETHSRFGQAEPLLLFDSVKNGAPTFTVDVEIHRD